MFKFLKDIEELKENVDEVENEVFKNGYSNNGQYLESRVNSLEQRLEAIMKYLNVVVDRTPYQPELKTKLIVRKKTKKDDEKENLSLIDGWYSKVSC